MLEARWMVPESVTRLSSIEDCRPELQQIHAHWDGLRGQRRMPARKDFDPIAVRSLLRHLMLIDVFADAPLERRFRVRLHGTAQVDYQKVDWTGAFIHEKTDKASADRLCAVGDQIITTRDPWMSTGGLYWMPDKPFSKFETILLPMSDDDDTVNMILGLTMFF